MAVHLAQLVERIGPAADELVGLRPELEFLERSGKHETAIHRRLVHLQIIAGGLGKLPELSCGAMMSDNADSPSSRTIIPFSQRFAPRKASAVSRADAKALKGKRDQSRDERAAGEPHRACWRTASSPSSGRSRTGESIPDSEADMAEAA